MLLRCFEHACSLISFESAWFSKLGLSRLIHRLENVWTAVDFYLKCSLCSLINALEAASHQVERSQRDFKTHALRTVSKAVEIKSYGLVGFLFCTAMTTN